MIYQKHVNTKLRIGHGGPPLRIQCMVLCTPGMGVNLWGESPLYVIPVNVNVFSTLTKVLAEGKGVSVRKGLKGWSEAQGEPQARTTKGSGNPECKAMSLACPGLDPGNRNSI